MRRVLVVAGAVCLSVAAVGCDSGLAPPETARSGVIEARIAYQGNWPPRDSLNDLRLVAMRFVPRDTTDFLELNRLAISSRLQYYVSADTVVVADVRPGVFVYTGVAQNYAANIFRWRPIGLYAENDGIFEVQSGDTTRLHITVDFQSLPPFPPNQ